MSSKVVRDKIKEQCWQLYISGLSTHKIADNIGIEQNQVWRYVHAMMNEIGHEKLSLKGIEYLSRWIGNQEMRVRRLMIKFNDQKTTHKELMDVIKSLQVEEELGIKKGMALGILNGNNINIIAQQNNQNIDVWAIIKASKEADIERITEEDVEGEGRKRIL